MRVVTGWNLILSRLNLAAEQDVSAVLTDLNGVRCAYLHELLMVLTVAKSR